MASRSYFPKAVRGIEIPKKKGSINPKVFKIIDPTIENPKEHLLLNRYRIVGKDDVGKRTVKLLNLNDFTKLVMNRAAVGEALSEKLET